MSRSSNPNSSILDSELQVLQNIHAHEDYVRQRDLARVVQLSLGMTNSIIKRLVQKGWLTIRRVNSRNLRYAVSPAGMEQISRRSYRFFRRTIKNIVYYREAIEGFVGDVRAQGFRGVLYLGRSDLDFIVEHACRVHGMELVRDDEKAGDPSRGERGLFTVYSESYIPDEEEKRARGNIAFLQDVVNARHLILFGPRAERMQ